MKGYPKQYPLDRQTLFGINTMGLMSTTAYYLYTAVLMMFITDYSGSIRVYPAKPLLWQRPCYLLAGYGTLLTTSGLAI